MYNPYLVIPFLVWAITQFLKFALAALRGRVDFRYLYASGGMPSVHAAVVTSLATTAFLIDGPKSSIFGVTAILAGIVMYDSFGVRRSSGEQAVAINHIMETLDHGHQGHPQLRLREILGHKPLEVTLGALAGLVLACLFNIDHLGPLFAILTIVVTKQIAIYLAIKVAVVAMIAIILRRIFMRKYRQIAVIQRFIKQAFWIAVSTELVVLVLAFLSYEKINGGNWLVWPVLTLVAGIAFAFGLLLPYRGKLSSALAEFRETADKRKWLEGPNKKRRAKKGVRARKRA